MKARLRANDAQKILEITDELSRAVSSEELMGRFLRDLMQIIPAVSASFNWFVQGRLHYVSYPELPPETIPGLERIMIENWRQNPLVEHFRTTADRRALRWRDLVDMSEWHRSVLYQEFYQPLGIEDQLGLQMPSPYGVAAALVVNGDHPFDDRDAAVLALLGPSVFAQLAGLDNQGSMNVVLNGLGWTVLLVDDDGLIIGEPPKRVAHLVDSRRHIIDELHTAVFCQPDTTPETGVQFVDTPVGPARVILTKNRMPPHTLFLSIVNDGDIETISALGNTSLSRREIDVVILMRHGASNAVIAQQLGISIGTVKKHLERIYRTLDVENRTAAAHKIRQLVNEKGRR